jgi:hypothetical protein
MWLYMAVTCDRYELPLFVTESLQEMAEWMGYTKRSVIECCSRNKKKPPFQIEHAYKIRLRRIEMEEEDE